MNRDQRLQELFDHAVDLPPSTREAWLTKQCADDAPLMTEVLALLQASDDEQPFWNRTAIEHEAEQLAAAPDPMIGSSIGAYIVTAVIGTGGMGRVYRAARADAAFDREVAIKRLHRGVDAHELIERFRAERRILASLDHPNIARLIDAGADADGAPYLVMECVDGVPPAEYCAREASSLNERLRLFQRICGAVHYAHQHMVIHRDLKPGNVLVTADGTPKLLDFGIAKLVAPTDQEASLQTAAPMMTLRYASPEQIRGDGLTTASDVYALGVLLYELVTNVSPYREPEAPTPVLMRAICDETPRLPSAAGGDRRCRGDVDNIVMKALRKDPSERYRSADQFAEDIGRFLDGLPVVAAGVSWKYRARKFVMRNVAAVSVAASVVVMLVVAVIVTRRAQAKAERRFNDVRRLAHAVVFDYHDAIENLPGSTPVRQRIVKDALVYLDSLSQEADSPALQRELIDAYVRISNVQGNTYNTNLGDTAAALTTAAKAVAAADVLIGRDPSGDSLRSAALAHSTEASLRYAAGELAQAEAEYQRALELGDRLIRAEPGNTEAALERASTLRFLGDLYGGNGFANLGKLAEGMGYYQRSADAVAAVVRAHPEHTQARRQQCEVMLLIGGAQSAAGDADGAMRTLQAALASMELLAAADPDNTLQRLELSNLNLRIGMQLIDARRAREAVPSIARSAEIMEKLSVDDPKSALYRRNRSVIENHWANALRSSGDALDALPHNRRALEIVQALSAADSLSGEYRADVAISHRKLGETELALGHAAAAEAEASAAIAMFTTMGAGGSTASPDASLDAQAGRAFLLRSDARRAQRDTSRAVSDAGRAIDIAIRLAATDTASAVFASDAARAFVSRGESLAQAGRLGEAIDAFARARERWSELAARHALTGEDAARADAASRRVSDLHARIKK